MNVISYNKCASILSHCFITLDCLVSLRWQIVPTTRLGGLLSSLPEKLFSYLELRLSLILCNKDERTDPCGEIKRWQTSDAQTSSMRYEHKYRIIEIKKLSNAMKMITVYCANVTFHKATIVPSIFQMPAATSGFCLNLINPVTISFFVLFMMFIYLTEIKTSISVHYTCQVIFTSGSEAAR